MVVLHPTLMWATIWTSRQNPKRYDNKLILFRRILSRKQLFALLWHHASLY